MPLGEASREQLAHSRVVSGCSFILSLSRNKPLRLESVDIGRFTENMYSQRNNKGSSLQSLLGKTIWRLPLRFEFPKLGGPGNSLRCALFHDIADSVSEFTAGLGVTLSVAEFEAKIEFLSRYYMPLTLDDYLEGRRKGSLPKRPALVTFDDAYASVALSAAPILRKYKVPAIFFVNASVVGNEELGLDNLLCHIENKSGFETLRSVARRFLANADVPIGSVENLFDYLLPAMSQEQIRAFRNEICAAAGICPSEIARKTQLYVSAPQLRVLAQSGVEIGSHTFSHVFCRSLVGSDFEREIYQNKSMLEEMTGSRVRAFSVPYGSPKDLTPELAQSLRRSGHEVAFLARNRSNSANTDLYRLNRVSVHAGTEGEFFGEIEILPRLRSLADVILQRNRALPKAPKS
jgi:peptidoglycan/xylan/chitin deacetylase (PgdA/CDA1 family)